MLALKNITAYILLWVYAISFGHQVLPHHHHDTGADHHTHITGADKHDAEDHNHVPHENHFDEGFIDYLACILASHQHNPATECEYANSIRDQKTGSNVDYRLVAVSTCFSVVEPLVLEKAEWKPNVNLKLLQNPCFCQIETRGPPLV